MLCDSEGHTNAQSDMDADPSSGKKVFVRSQKAAWALTPKLLPGLLSVPGSSLQLKEMSSVPVFWNPSTSLEAKPHWG